MGGGLAGTNAAMGAAESATGIPRETISMSIAVTRSGGRTPRDVALHPGGRHLLAANQDGGGVTVLALDDEGVPGDVVAAHPVDHPVCVTVVEVDA